MCFGTPPARLYRKLREIPSSAASGFAARTRSDKNALAGPTREFVRRSRRCRVLGTPCRAFRRRCRALDPSCGILVLVGRDLAPAGCVLVTRKREFADCCCVLVGARRNLAPGRSILAAICRDRSRSGCVLGRARGIDAGSKCDLVRHSRGLGKPACEYDCRWAGPSVSFVGSVRTRTDHPRRWPDQIGRCRGEVAPFGYERIVSGYRGAKEALGSTQRRPALLPAHDLEISSITFY
jgi:hypothetical protein